ncbi:hypothetical protein [Actinokineospora enzanensis]|uniref:hypothetical protein n=1 Tax=Actinokineospora enzanensis TaxID=155975 RepID=UPI0003774BC6|nr:hypothetical protein [Actinokineospora enzanensis]
MSRASRRLVPAAVATVLLPLLVTSAQAAGRGPLLSAGPLPLPPGQTGASVVDVNERGDIVGESGGPTHVALWRGDGVTDLGAGSPTGINDRGQVAGTEYIAGPSGTYERTPKIWYRGAITVITLPNRGYVATGPIAEDGTVPVTFPNSVQGYHMENIGYWKDGTYTALSAPSSNGPHLSLNVVNNRGLTAGSYLPMFGTRAYAFRCQLTACVELPTISDATGNPAPVAANDRGVVVGNIGATAVRWEGSAVTPLPALPGGGATRVSANRQAVNQRGDVVGTSGDRAVLWRAGQAVDLGSPLGGASAAVAVNDLGDVVGYTSSPDGAQRHVFLWRDGKATDLGTAGAPNAVPVGLNNHGVIIGRADLGAPTYGTLPLRWVVRTR